jgi:serine/threonine protein phosphatase 1
LEALLDQLALASTDELYFLGDLIDRGPDSKGVIDLVFSLKEKGHKVRCLTGNHEDALLIATKDQSFFYQWYDGWGGRQALESFGVHFAAAIPQLYLDFFKKLEYCIEVDNYILSESSCMATHPSQKTI